MGYDKRVRPNYGGKCSRHVSQIYFLSAQQVTSIGWPLKKKGPQFWRNPIISYHTKHVIATHIFARATSHHKQRLSLHLWHHFWCLVFKRIRLPLKRKFGQKSEEKERIDGWTISHTRNIFHILFFSFLGTAVTVGVTMFVLSISELSEVGMVRKREIFYFVN